MRVFLTRKHADIIDDVDLKGHYVGDVLDLSEAEARLLVAEEWAKPDRRLEPSSGHERRRHDDVSPYTER